MTLLLSFTLLILAFISPLTSASFSYDGQEPIYDGRENIPGSILELKDEGMLDWAISELGYLPVVDRVFPPQIMVQFLEAIAWKIMPGNTSTSLTLLTEDELFNLATNPYAEWAPSPYDKLPGHVYDRVQMRIASHEDSTGLQVVDKTLHAMKVRLWEDIMPLTRNQWRRKHMNEPENFDLACQYLGVPIHVFAYLNIDTVQASLRGVFNNIAKEWKNFEDAVSAIRQTKGEPSVSVTALWEEFVRLRWSIMATHAHDWVMEYVNELRTPLIKQLEQHEPLTFDTLSTEQWNITNKLHLLAEIASRAGFTIVLPMNGYTGYVTPASEGESLSPSLDTRREAYTSALQVATRLKELSRREGANSAEINAHQKPFRGPAEPADLVQGILSQKEAQEDLRREYAGHFTRPLAAEEWILQLKRQMDQPEYGFDKWGFVMYRITYKQSDEEWEGFMQKLKADIDDWEDGIKGGDLIRASAQLKWINGREVGIVEGDYEAAKRHFLALREQDDFQTNSDWDEEMFLFVDSASVESYLHPIDTTAVDLQPQGDFGGFVTAVDASFDPNDPGEHAEESPGFTGRMRISGNLLWSDLFALRKAQAASAEDLWPLAIHHPWQVYVGAVVPKQRELWKRTSQKYDRNTAFKRLVQSI